MKAILRSINNFSCKLKQSNNLKYNISPKIRSNKFKNISGNGNVTIEDAIDKNAKDYKIYGNTVQSKLPSGYTQVDYIESDGNQYINTGVNADSNLSVKMNFSSNYHIQQRHMGAIKNDNGVYTRHHITINGSSAVNYLISYSGQTNSAQNLLSTIDDNKHYLNLDIYNKKVSVDEETPIDLTLQPFDTELNYWLFARNSNNSTNMSFAIMQIYDCKMYYSDVLVRDFIPCYRNSDNEVGLYDLVNNVFYTNQGTGSFTYGNMAPTPDAPIEMVSCGDRTKNLFDKNNANIINGYIQGNTGKIILGNSDLIAYIKCKPNTQYSFQRMQIRDNKGRLRIGTTQTIPIADMAVENFYYKGNSEYSTNKLDGYTTGANAEYLLFYFSQISGMSQNEIDTILSSIQIEENSIATSHEPYGYKIPINVNNSITNIYLDEPLRKIGEYSDYIDFANGKIVRKIYEYKITGNENWLKTYGDNLFNIDSIFNDKPFIVGYGLSNMYIYNSVQSGINNNTLNGEFALQKYVGSRHTDYNLFVKNTSYSNKDLFKTYLQSLYNSNTPVVISCPLETPTEEDIELPNINLIEGKNIITIGTDVQGVFETEYYSKEIIDISNYKYNLRKVED